MEKERGPVEEEIGHLFERAGEGEINTRLIPIRLERLAIAARCLPEGGAIMARIVDYGEIYRQRNRGRAGIRDQVNMAAFVDCANEYAKSLMEGQKEVESLAVLRTAFQWTTDFHLRRRRAVVTINMVYVSRRATLSLPKERNVEKLAILEGAIVPLNELAEEMGIRDDNIAPERLDASADLANNLGVLHTDLAGLRLESPNLGLDLHNVNEAREAFLLSIKLLDQHTAKADLETQKRILTALSNLIHTFTVSGETRLAIDPTSPGEIFHEEVSGFLLYNERLLILLSTIPSDIKEKYEAEIVRRHAEFLLFLSQIPKDNYLRQTLEQNPFLRRLGVGPAGKNFLIIAERLLEQSRELITDDEDEPFQEKAEEKLEKLKADTIP